MDDTLHALPEIDSLQELFLKLKECLGCAGLYIAPDKLQYTEHFQYLGNRVTHTTNHKRYKYAETQIKL